MPTSTALVLPAARSADAALVPTPAHYENWRPPVIGVSLFIPVGTDGLVVADPLGSTMLPTGTVRDGQTLEQAAEDVLGGAPDGLPALRRVVMACVQMRRRKVITHVLATAPMSRASVARLTYRDRRVPVRVLPTVRVIGELPVQGRLRVLVTLQALATGEMAYIEGGVVRPAE